MAWAIRKQGVGKEPAWRWVEGADELVEGEEFYQGDPRDKVEGANGKLRKMTKADRDRLEQERREAEKDSEIGRPLLRALIEDVAALKGVTPQEYVADLKARMG